MVNMSLSSYKQTYADHYNLLSIKGMGYRPTLHLTKRVRSTRIARKKICQLPVQCRGFLQIVCEKYLNVCLID